MMLMINNGMARLGCLLLALLVLAMTPAASLALEPAEVLAKVQDLYNRGGAFKTWFRQETRPKDAAQGETAEGWMYFMKPSRMRWQYEKPADQKKEVVSDGRQVWIYLPDDALALVYPLNQALRSDLVMRFFSGIGEVRQEFHLSWERPPSPGAPYVINLAPRQPQPELKRLTLTINPQTYLVEKLSFANALEEETRFDFSRTTLNVKVAPSFFTFTPPAGVQIVREAPGTR